MSRMEELLAAVRAVQDSVSKLERELMVTLAKNESPAASSPSPAEEWLTLAQVGEWLQVGRSTVYRLVSSKEIPGYRVGRAIRVRRADVERWLEENRW